VGRFVSGWGHWLANHRRFSADEGWLCGVATLGAERAVPCARRPQINGIGPRGFWCVAPNSHVLLCKRGYRRSGPAGSAAAEANGRYPHLSFPTRQRIVPTNPRVGRFPSTWHETAQLPVGVSLGKDCQGASMDCCRMAVVR
jgi:hypothetical protein